MHIKPFLWMILVIAPAMVVADEELEQPASWAIPTAVEVRAQLNSFLETKQLDEVTRLKISALWPDEGGPQQPAEMLNQIATTLAVTDTQAREVVDFCQQTQDAAMPGSFEFLKTKDLHPFLKNNLRLFYGRWLAQNRFYDEAAEQLTGLLPDDVVDPAALLFFQSVSFHRLLDKKQCLPAVNKLLENETKIPRRYSTVAQLIEADLGPLETDSLDEISRMMDEINRRLALHRAGTRVRKQEDDVIAKLDKIIKKLEDQQKKSSSSATLQPSNPAQDSMPMGGRGPGEVDPRQIGSKSGWGNLPPKQREEALQQISKDLPAHYREIIEEYFRRLASEGGG